MTRPPATILIVDDERKSRRLLEALLLPEGYLTQSAASGEEALTLIAQRAPDLILLDVMMPGMNGYEVASVLKANPAVSNIPIIMLTALTDRGARLAGLEAGAEDFLTKPVDRAELWLRVRNLLRLKEFGDFLQNHGRILEEQVQARASQLQAANEELLAFSYAVSHDLRTPLSTIAGFSGLLDKEADADNASARSKHYIARIRAGVVQMSELIDSLLSLAHVSRTSLRWDRVDLSTLAQTILDSYQEREPGRVVQLDIQPELVVQGDPTLLRNVLDNLLGNAWKFSSQQPLTRIAFRQENGADGQVVYVVQDTGAGFDMAYSDKLFGAFQRLHTAAEFAGSGIGLATVHRIVMRHGGKVWADSAPGCGATFYFTLLGDRLLENV
jgi:signal transduction histidine kinase